LRHFPASNSRYVPFRWSASTKGRYLFFGFIVKSSG